MAERKPVRERYDACFDFVRPGERGLYALVKRTFELLPDGGLAAAAPVALENDLRDPELSPSLPAESDFWPVREAVDVIVKGSAVAPGGAAFSSATARVAVGDFEKRVHVSGPRRVLFGLGGSPRLEAEPTREVPLTWQCAYGGADDRIQGDRVVGLEEGFELFGDHPGLYPRNPFGLGYALGPEPPPELWLPQLEDPGDRLSLDRLMLSDPALWWQRPLPWCFDAVHPAAYPRSAWFAPDAEPWHPGPDDVSLPEVARGYLPPGYRNCWAGEGELVHRRFLREASHGMTFDELAAGTPVVVEGMHVEHARLGFELPPAPRLAVSAEGVRQEPPLSLYKLVIEPGARRVTTLYGTAFESHRAWIPGIHPEIPIALEIDGDLPLGYQAPEPVRQRVRDWEAKGQPTG